MEGSAFSPEEITVAAGETVIWKNTSDRAHSVTAHEDGIPDGAKYFASGGAASEEQARDETAEGLLKPGESFELTFEEPASSATSASPRGLWHDGNGSCRGMTVVRRGPPFREALRTPYRYSASGPSSAGSGGPPLCCRASR
jgi:plastocyanin